MATLLTKEYIEERNAEGEEHCTDLATWHGLGVHTVEDFHDYIQDGPDLEEPKTMKCECLDDTGLCGPHHAADEACTRRPCVRVVLTDPCHEVTWCWPCWLSYIKVCLDVSEPIPVVRWLRHCYSDNCEE